MALSKEYVGSTRYIDDCQAVLLNGDIQGLVRKIRNVIPVKKRDDWMHKQIAWCYGLRHHPDPQYVNQVMLWNTFGWPIAKSEFFMCEGTKQNYTASIEEIKAGLEKILKLVKKGRFLGPFHSESEVRKQFPGVEFKIWPIFYKKEDGKFRMLVDLSFNKLGLAINDCITQQEKSVQYLTIKEIVQWIVDCDIKFLWAIDAWMAYYCVPIPEEMIPYLGIKICGMYFFFTTLSMGLASAPKLYTEFADVINWIVVNNNKHLFLSLIGPPNNKRLIKMLRHYVDDFLGGARTKKRALAQMYWILYWWNILGVPTQERKITPPCEVIAFIGFLFDCSLRALRVTWKRLDEYRILTNNTVKVMKYCIVKEEKIYLNYMQSVVGKIRSIQMVYPSLIPHIRSLERMNNVPGQKINNKWVYDVDKVAVTHEAISDLELIHNRLKIDSKNVWPFDWFLATPQTCDITIFTDASTTRGVGGFCDIRHGEWFGELWNKYEIYNNFQFKPDITFLELAGVIIGAITSIHRLRNKKILFRCDNEAACWIMLKRSACLHRPDLIELMKIFCQYAWDYNFRMYPKHIKGVLNTDADNLSRILKLIKNRNPPLSLHKSDIDPIAIQLLKCWDRKHALLIESNGETLPFQLRHCGCSNESSCNVQQYTQPIDK